MEELAELGRYPDAALAHILKGRLEAAGIPAFCLDSGMNAAESAPGVWGVRLMVRPEDLAEAREVLSEEVAPDDFDPIEPSRTRSCLIRLGLILLVASFILPALIAGFAG